MRIVKVIVATLLGFALGIAGVVMLANGFSDHRYALAAGGAAAIVLLLVWIALILNRSKRQVNAQIAVIEAKRQAGIRTCGRCKLDFEEAMAPRTAKPWHHTALLMLLSLVPIVFGMLVIFSFIVLRGLVDPADAWDRGIKAGIIMIFGVAGFVYSIKGSRDLYVRCPKCGRYCGSVRRTAPGFAVESKGAK